MPRDQAFFEPARIERPRLLDPALTSSLWTLMFTLPTLMAAVTVNLSHDGQYDFLVNFAILNIFVIYGGSVLAGIVIGLPLFWALQRLNLQFGILYMLVGFILYGLLFVYMNVEMHLGLYDRLSAQYGDIFDGYLRGIRLFRYLWPSYGFLGMAIALTAWARLIRF